MQNNKPIEVDVQLSLLNLRAFDEGSLTYKADVWLSMTWTDYRIRGPAVANPVQGLELDDEWHEQLWTPRINFKNAFKTEVVNQHEPAMYLTVFNRTRVRLSERLSLDLICLMSFGYYPHDRQTCNIDVMSRE